MTARAPRIEASFEPGEWDAIQSERERIVAALLEAGLRGVRSLPNRWRRKAAAMIRERGQRREWLLDQEVSALLLRYARTTVGLSLFARLPFSDWERYAPGVVLEEDVARDLRLAAAAMDAFVGHAAREGADLYGLSPERSGTPGSSSRVPRAFPTPGSA